MSEREVLAIDHQCPTEWGMRDLEELVWEDKAEEFSFLYVASEAMILHSNKTHRQGGSGLGVKRNAGWIF